MTPLLKKIVGRERPNRSDDPYSFSPFSSQDSFPSNHATTAFALASGIAAHYDGWVVPTIAYTVASSVAASRLNDNVHWASDVVAGAIIGTEIGHFIVRRHRRNLASTATMNVGAGPGGGILVHITY